MQSIMFRIRSHFALKLTEDLKHLNIDKSLWKYLTNLHTKDKLSQIIKKNKKTAKTQKEKDYFELLGHYVKKGEKESFLSCCITLQSNKDFIETRSKLIYNMNEKNITTNTETISKSTNKSTKSKSTNKKKTSKDINTYDELICNKQNSKNAFDDNKINIIRSTNNTSNTINYSTNNTSDIFIDDKISSANNVYIDDQIYSKNIFAPIKKHTKSTSSQSKKRNKRIHNKIIKKDIESTAKVISVVEKFKKNKQDNKLDLS